VFGTTVCTICWRQLKVKYSFHGPKIKGERKICKQNIGKKSFPSISSQCHFIIYISCYSGVSYLGM
jgi:hypothetical protein